MTMRIRFSHLMVKMMMMWDDRATRYHIQRSAVWALWVGSTQKIFLSRSYQLPFCAWDNGNDENKIYTSDGDDDDVRRLHSTQEITLPARLAASLVCVREANFDHRLFLGPVLRSFPCELMLRRRIVMMIMAMMAMMMMIKDQLRPTTVFLLLWFF